MKKFLKFSAVFVLGLFIGGAAAGYFAGRTYKQMFGGWQMLQIANDIVTLESYRNNEADRFFEVIEKGIPEYVLMIDQNDEMNDSGGYLVLKNAKRFYLCTKTPVPNNIEKIMEEVKLAPDFSCRP